jgi:glycosyltransferase involved in cell wall biosynthesis
MIPNRKPQIPQILGYVTPVRAFRTPQGIYMQAASGRVADALARHYEKIYICTRVVADCPHATGDQPLEASNVELIAQPFWRTSAGSLPHFVGIARAYFQTCRRADVLFVRGMCPFIAVLYAFAYLFRRPICHWIVGDPVALLRSSRRNGRVLDSFALLYALQDRLSSRVGRWLTNGAFVCNGHELARAYRSPRTTAVVSSTVRETEFSFRADSCQGQIVRILFVGFIRPEKGIEHLLNAVILLDPKIRWELEIVGTDEFPEYWKRLDGIVETRRLDERVRWAGYMPYGRPSFDCVHAADIFVLPTLSEGTPHVLVEVRANSLPCISTTVGGVPSTVRHGFDALLVPPGNPEALAHAIDRIIRDGEFRRQLIRNGWSAARRQTLERFVATVRRELEADVEAREPVVAHRQH